MLSDTTMYWVNSYVNIVPDADVSDMLYENLEPIDDIDGETKYGIVKMTLAWVEGTIEHDTYTIEIKDFWYNIFDDQHGEWSYSCKILEPTEWVKSYL